MKKITQLLLAVTIIFFTVSCKNTTNKKIEQEQPQQTEEQHHNDTEELKLNNGNLWEANAETTNGISAMISLMNSFKETENIEAYASLKQGLETEFGTIITECTMQGESHNQLHNYLIPMKETFDGIGSNNIATCKTSFEKLNKHLAAYANFFE